MDSISNKNYQTLNTKMNASMESMEKKKVFFIMPFQDEFFEVYEMVKTEFSDSFEFSNAEAEGNQQNVLKDVIQPIYDADVIVADLTGLNPNVMYELGLAHAFNKKTITITQDDLSKLPFDLKQYRAKDYNTHFKKFAELIDYLRVNLKGAIDNSVIYGNPVKDFIGLNNITNVPWFSNEATIELPDESDKGFLDFMADIESNTELLTTNINEMTQDMNEMAKGISHSTSEINRINGNGGNGTASFIRKETRKAASHIETFSQKLKAHNKSMLPLWDEIEKNTLGLLENPFSEKAENKPGLINYLKSLYDLKGIVPQSAKSISELRTEMEGIVGIERSMNQAVRFANEDLITYVNFTERLCASIDKILAKAKFVVGEIDYDKINIQEQQSHLKKE